jgi:ubiquinone/menaquinone biosynthesis C-methylase UbiE
MSTEYIYQSVLRLASPLHRKHSFRQHLDIGAGSGSLIKAFQQKFQVESWACDYTESLMKLPGQKVEVADLNVENLPYADASFDVVTATEVIEHLEHYRQTLREIHRVLRPGGCCILSTPNVLNINSRLRYFFAGFANLFGPLPIKNSALYSTGGHINPVGYFYIAHSLYDAGFDKLEVR